MGSGIVGLGVYVWGFIYFSLGSFGCCSIFFYEVAGIGSGYSCSYGLCGFGSRSGYRFGGVGYRYDW